MNVRIFLLAIFSMGLCSCQGEYQQEDLFDDDQYRERRLETDKRLENKKGDSMPLGILAF